MIPNLNESLPFWLGTWTLGGEGFGPSDERESRRVLALAYEQGIRQFDTAGFYSHGNSEKLLQKELGSVRRNIFISSKGGLKWDGKTVLHDGSASHLRETLYQSLERLQTDYLDLYSLHWPDSRIPLSESLHALQEFQKEGLIRQWGICNLSATDIQKEIPENSRIPHQIPFNLIRRQKESLTTGAQRNRCLNVIYSPLEQGLLGQTPPVLSNRDVRRRNPEFSSPQTLEWLKSLRGELQTSPLSLPHLSLLWILSHPEIHAVILGARTTQQLQDCLNLRDLFPHTLASRESIRAFLQAQLSAQALRLIALTE